MAKHSCTIIGKDSIAGKNALPLKFYDLMHIWLFLIFKKKEMYQAIAIVRR